MAQTASPRRVHQYQNNSPVLYHRGGYKYSVYLELSPFVSEDFSVVEVVRKCVERKKKATIQIGQSKREKSTTILLVLCQGDERRLRRLSHGHM